MLLGWVGFPLMYALFPALPLRGFAIGRGLIWLLISILPWWLTSVLGRFFWTRPGLWVLVLIFVAINAIIAYRRRAELTAYLREHWRALLVSELIFLVALGVGLLLRAVDPDLWEIARGGEKPMDYAYLNAILRTAVFPPPNPWMAGYPINYYYFGFVIAAVPIKLGNIASGVGYNLVLGTLYAVVFSTVFTLAYALLPEARRITKTLLALVGAVFAMVAGNLGTLKLIVAPEPNMESHRWYWYPTRILGKSLNHAGGAINEMPLFSFLFGDLHAHILGLLPTMLFLVGIWALNKQRRWWIALLLGVIAGAIYMTNIWDVLIYVPLGALLLWFAARGRVRFLWWGFLIGLGGLITVAPYAQHLSLGSTAGITLWNGDRSLIEPFVLVWGIPIGIAVIWMFSRARQLAPLFANRGIQISILVIVVVILLALPPTVSTTALCLGLAAAALALAWRDAPEMRFAHLGVALIFAVLLALEYVVVIGDVGRMNTVFKISFQLWMWCGLLIPAILFWMLRSRRYFSAAVMLVLIGLGLLFPLYAIPARHEENSTGQLTLDGNRFFEDLNLPEGSAVSDQHIINYLRTYVGGYPVIAEWYQSEYQWNSRFSVQTGLPAIVGWGNHMRQQYGALASEVDQRIDDMQTLYTTDNVSEVRRILEKYKVQYVIVGRLERVYATPAALDNFEAMVRGGELVRAFVDEDAVVYRINYYVIPTGEGS